MRRVCLSLWFCACASVPRAPDGNPPAGFTPVAFEASPHWKLEAGGVIAHDGQGKKNFVSVSDHGDIELLADWKIGPAADSGIYLRGTPQIQIWDPDNPEQKKHGNDKGSGGLWNNKDAGKWPAVRADRAIGEWNSFRVKMIGARVWIWLNGQAVVVGAPLDPYKDKTRPIPARGRIELQTHDHPLWFRNVVVREIAHEEAVKTLAADEQGFEPLWNGKDFTGWAGAVENYEIADGAIRCAAGKGGVLYAKQEFSDFVARVEFKLPPGGNNGMAIRYPGQGDTAYVGMTELQVLDDTSPKYATMDPRQAHGSAYGMAAAHRGYLRPVGEWNYQEVTVRGSAIKVELNGTVILDADLSGVTDFMASKPHPGKDRTSGYFGFAGHSDPVAFRNVRVKKL